MCGRFTITAEIEDILDTFAIDEMNMEYRKNYNCAPTQFVPCVVEREGKRILEAYRWGLVPWFSKDLKIAYKTINARAEGIETKPSYRHLLKRNRVLVISDGFLEWQKIEKEKQPYRFQLKSKGVYGFAGLFDTWRNPDDEASELKTCTIITTSPNELVADVHDRMPVILDPESAARWLSPDLSDTAEVLRFLKPFPAEEMFKYPVSADIGSVKNNGASLIEEITLNSL